MNGLARKKMMNRIMSGIFTAGAVGASLLLFACLW